MSYRDDDQSSVPNSQHAMVGGVHPASALVAQQEGLPPAIDMMTMRRRILPLVV